MPSAYESAVATKAIYKISEVTFPKNPAADLERGADRIAYMPKDRMYEGKADIADIVKTEKDPVKDAYQNPVKVLAGKSPERDVYSALLNYEFMN
jgi:hypothetical protein